MFMLLLMTIAADPAKLLQSASARLRATCEGPACERPVERSRYRIDDDDAIGIDAKGRAIGIDAKGRAIGDTGSRCDVVGARVCTRKPRTLFRSGLGD